MRKANRSGKVRSRSRMSRYSSHDAPGYEPVSARGSTSWKLAASATPGIGCSTIAWIQENTAVFTPIPMPSDTMTTAANPGIRQIIRHACRTSLIMLSSARLKGSRSVITLCLKTRATRCAL